MVSQLGTAGNLAENELSLDEHHSGTTALLDFQQYLAHVDVPSIDSITAPYSDAPPNRHEKLYEFNLHVLGPKISSQLQDIAKKECCVWQATTMHVSDSSFW